MMDLDDIQEDYASDAEDVDKPWEKKKQWV
jgi:hypothetical protein